jgi:hypothetical protein
VHMQLWKKILIFIGIFIEPYYALEYGLYYAAIHKFKMRRLVTIELCCNHARSVDAVSQIAEKNRPVISGTLAVAIDLKDMDHYWRWPLRSLKKSYCRAAGL